MKYEDAAFLMMFFVRDQVPVASRRQFNLGPNSLITPMARICRRKESVKG